MVQILSFFSGPDAGALGQTKNYKKVTPPSTYSPFVCQGDIGFFHYKKKTYGQFFCLVQTYTKRIYAQPLANLKSTTLIKAIQNCLQVR